MKKPILVTGSHRSGSTWVGEVIAKSSKVDYIHEPFNISIKRYNQPFDHWFEFISEYCSDTHQNKVEAYLNSFIGWPNSRAWKRLFSTSSFYELYANTSDVFNFRRRFTQRTLFKDPIALASSQWIHDKFAADVVVIIRHPAAFVASIKMKDWQFDFSNFNDQKNLMSIHLSDFKSEIENASLNQPDIIETGILLWNSLYTIVRHFQENRGDNWYFAKHEDLSLHPHEEFNKIFDFLKLDFTDKVADYITKSTNATVKSKTQRNSADNIHTWKSRLNPEEIERIKKGTESVWTHFYSETDW